MEGKDAQGIRGAYWRAPNSTSRSRESFSEQMMLELHPKKEAEASQQDNLRNTTFLFFQSF